MSMTRDEQRAYMRGYQRGKAGKWPDMATVSDERFRVLAQAAKQLADAVDEMLCQFDDRDDDPMQVAIDDARHLVLCAIQEAWNEVAAQAPEAPHA